MQINNEITLAEFSFPSQFVVMGLLATSARRRLDFRSRCDIGLGRDEYFLIQVIDAMQLGAAGLWVRCQRADRLRYPIASLH